MANAPGFDRRLSRQLDWEIKAKDWRKRYNRLTPGNQQKLCNELFTAILVTGLYSPEYSELAVQSWLNVQQGKRSRRD